MIDAKTTTVASRSVTSDPGTASMTGSMWTAAIGPGWWTEPSVRSSKSGPPSPKRSGSGACSASSSGREPRTSRPSTSSDGSGMPSAPSSDRSEADGQKPGRPSEANVEGRSRIAGGPLRSAQAGTPRKGVAAEAATPFRARSGGGRRGSGSTRLGYRHPTTACPRSVAIRAQQCNAGTALHRHVGVAYPLVCLPLRLGVGIAPDTPVAEEDAPRSDAVVDDCE